jgi:hypothetical protein
VFKKHQKTFHQTDFIIVKIILNNMTLFPSGDCCSHCSHFVDEKRIHLNPYYGHTTMKNKDGILNGFARELEIHGSDRIRMKIFH